MTADFHPISTYERNLPQLLEKIGNVSIKSDYETGNVIRSGYLLIDFGILSIVQSDVT